MKSTSPSNKSSQSINFSSIAKIKNSYESVPQSNNKTQKEQINNIPPQLRNIYYNSKQNNYHSIYNSTYNNNHINYNNINNNNININSYLQSPPPLADSLYPIISSQIQSIFPNLPQNQNFSKINFPKLEESFKKFLSLAGKKCTEFKYPKENSKVFSYIREFFSLNLKDKKENNLFNNNLNSINNIYSNQWTRKSIKDKSVPFCVSLSEKIETQPKMLGTKTKRKKKDEIEVSQQSGNEINNSITINIQSSNDTIINNINQMINNKGGNCDENNKSDINNDVINAMNIKIPMKSEELNNEIKKDGIVGESHRKCLRDIKRILLEMGDKYQSDNYKLEKEINFFINKVKFKITMRRENERVESIWIQTKDGQEKIIKKEKDISKKLMEIKILLEKKK